MTKAFLALGSNLQDPTKQVRTAVAEIAELSGTVLLQCSRLYRTPPFGILEQPDFVNAAVEVETILSPEELLQALLIIEKKHERIRKQKNGPRTLDVDILLYGQEVIDNKFLQVPHPRLTERAFVLVPLAEIAPQWMLPCGRTVSECLEDLERKNIELIEG